ncbi:hypothetical protein M3182_17005 [Mesobacillus maritimus]|uniref:hypothetical protein n=1 Tax=Mesobacillus maritimus TaxID=1643336 RepID=UPI00204256C1|nr:hypothetical protein [Mesobacillus maritimus]MCM3587436.1 hypothetical protein [Mesobacillus maritimus]MCM3672184.1 hypothetical protein [Mesobacillus maritimus]
MSKRNNKKRKKRRGPSLTEEQEQALIKEKRKAKWLEWLIAIIILIVLVILFSVESIVYSLFTYFDGDLQLLANLYITIDLLFAIIKVLIACGLIWLGYYLANWLRKSKERSIFIVLIILFFFGIGMMFFLASILETFAYLRLIF